MPELSHYLGVLVNLRLIDLEGEFDMEGIKCELEERFKVYASGNSIMDSLESLYYQLKYDSEYREVY